MSRVAVALVAALAVISYVFIYSTGRAGLPIRSDGFSYHVYLPAWFIHHDPSLDTTAGDCCGGEFPTYTAMFRWPGTRRWVNPHPIGCAVMETPLFVVAHALTKWTNLPADGFSLYYQHAAGISGLLWAVAGLWILRGVLLGYFTDGVTTATLIGLVFGTNLFHYTTYDSVYSHAYSFFLFAAFLSLTKRWHDAPARGKSLMLGLTAGLIVLTRHTNALFLIMFPLYGVTSASAVRDRLRRFREHRTRIAEIAGVAAAVIAPQLAMYFAATGRLLVSAYGDVGFNFSSPRIGGVLFSVQKGLFFWSPILLLAVAGLARLASSRNAAGAFLLPAAIILAVNTWLIASWWDWQFGGSYGHRGFVDLLPVFAIGLAAAFEWTADHRAAIAPVVLFASAAVILSTFQMLQYWDGVIPIHDTTWDDYRSFFLRWN